MFDDIIKKPKCKYRKPGSKSTIKRLSDYSESISEGEFTKLYEDWIEKYHNMGAKNV